MGEDGEGEEELQHLTGGGEADGAPEVAEEEELHGGQVVGVQGGGQVQGQPKVGVNFKGKSEKMQI